MAGATAVTGVCMIAIPVGSNGNTASTMGSKGTAESSNATSRSSRACGRQLIPTQNGRPAAAAARQARQAAVDLPVVTVTETMMPGGGGTLTIDVATAANATTVANIKAAIDAGHTRYTAPDGIPELKAAVCRKFARDNGLDYRPSQVTVGTGGKQVLFNALMATLNPGDEVIIPAPYWVSYPDMVLLAGGTPVIVPGTIETGFRITPAALEAAITPRTKWLIFNSPSNPTGAIYTPEETAEIGRWAGERGIWVLTDEIYEHLVYGDTPFSSIAPTPELEDRWVIVNGVAKTFAMTGWRVGWMIGPNDVVKAAAFAFQVLPQVVQANVKDWLD